MRPIPPILITKNRCFLWHVVGAHMHSTIFKNESHLFTHKKREKSTSFSPSSGRSDRLLTRGQNTLLANDDRNPAIAKWRKLHGTLQPHPSRGHFLFDHQDHHAPAIVELRKRRLQCDARRRDTHEKVSRMETCRALFSLSRSCSEVLWHAGRVATQRVSGWFCGNLFGATFRPLFLLP